MPRTEMAERILEYVRQNGAASFIELVRAAGPEAEGQLQMALPGRPNTVLWVGVSNEFVDALEELKPDIEPRPAHLLVYLADGGMLRLPLVRRMRKVDFSKPHWLPVVFNTRRPG